MQNKWISKHHGEQKKPDTKKYILYLWKDQEQAELTHNDRSKKNRDMWRWGDWLESVERTFSEVGIYSTS